MPPGVSPDMEVLTKAEVQVRYDEIVQKIREGAIFIHPSDTIYGLGCNALNVKAVERVRRLKEQFHQPLSIWVPSLEWVREHCVIISETEVALKKLPGPYTIVITLKNSKSIAPNVTLGKKTIGIRLPDHWFGKVVKKGGVPIITTSANKTGQKFMTSLQDLHKDIEESVEFMLYEGPKEARPSKILNMVDGTVKER